MEEMPKRRVLSAHCMITQLHLYHKPPCTVNMQRRGLRSHSARRASIRLTELDDDGKNDKAEQGDGRTAREDHEERSPLPARVNGHGRGG